MAWIESHQSLGRHPKLGRLADLLDISRPTAVGHLHYLWWWCLDFAQDGDLSRYTAEEIAEAAMWEGDADRFVGALVSAGLLDTDPLRLHDWWEYAGRLVERRQRDAERKRLARRRTSAGHPQDVRRTSARTQPNPTEPNQTQPDLSLADGIAANTTEARATPEREGLSQAVFTSGEEPPASAGTTPVAALEPPAPPAKAYQAQLREELGRSPQTRAEFGAWGAAIRELRTATPPVLPDELPSLIARYRSLWPDAVCTPMAIAKHLGLLRGPPPKDRSARPKSARLVDRSDYAGDLDEYAELARRKAEGGNRGPTQ